MSETIKPFLRCATRQATEASKPLLLEAHQIEYENWQGQKMQVTKRVDGVFQIYFKDPDGYWIEINDAKR